MPQAPGINEPQDHHDQHAHGHGVDGANGGWSDEEHGQPDHHDGQEDRHNEFAESPTRVNVIAQVAPLWASLGRFHSRGLALTLGQALALAGLLLAQRRIETVTTCSLGFGAGWRRPLLCGVPGYGLRLCNRRLMVSRLGLLSGVIPLTSPLFSAG